MIRPIIFAAALSLGLAVAGTAEAQSKSSRTAPVNPATDHHGLPGNNPGFGGASANPQGKGKNGGGGIHGIGNVPGQSGVHPNSDGTPGFRSKLNTVHGGLGGGHGGGHGGHQAGMSSGRGE